MPTSKPKALGFPLPQGARLANKQANLQPTVARRAVPANRTHTRTHLPASKPEAGLAGGPPPPTWHPVPRGVWAIHRRLWLWVGRSVSHFWENRPRIFGIRLKDFRLRVYSWLIQVDPSHTFHIHQRTKLPYVPSPISNIYFRQNGVLCRATAIVIGGHEMPRLRQEEFTKCRQISI